MKSRVPPKYKTTYRVGNWREYERALVQRGDVTLWLSADATDAWRPSPSGRPGGQKRFSDVAIETALVRRLVFGLPVRQTEGFVRSVLALRGADLDAPDHPTLSRRSQQLAVMLRRIPAPGPIHLIVESTGLSIVGQGAWAVAKHGGHGKRGWKKLHLGGDRSGVIVAQALTDAHVDDATTAVDLIPVVEGKISRVTADAAYDTVAVYEAAGGRGAKVVVPPKRTAAVSRRRPRSVARDRTVKRVQEVGRRRWKKEAGSHRQARVENVFFRYTSIIGDGLRARSAAGQGSEGVLACNVLNRMRDLGRPASYAIGRRPTAGSGLLRATSDSCNKAAWHRTVHLVTGLQVSPALLARQGVGPVVGQQPPVRGTLVRVPLPLPGRGHGAHHVNGSLRVRQGIVKLRLTAGFDAQHGGFATS